MTAARVVGGSGMAGRDLISTSREGGRDPVVTTVNGDGVVQDGGDGPVPLSLRRGTEERGKMKHHEGRAGRNRGGGETHGGRCRGEERRGRKSPRHCVPAEHTGGHMVF